MTYSKINPNQLKYLSSYPLEVQNKIRTMVEQDTLESFLLKKHPKTHDINNDKMLREYVMNLKNTHLRKSSPLSKVIYDKKIHVVNNALGLHTFVSRVQGNKLKSKKLFQHLNHYPTPEYHTIEDNYGFKKNKWYVFKKNNVDIEPVMQTDSIFSLLLSVQSSDLATILSGPTAKFAKTNHELSVRELTDPAESTAIGIMIPSSNRLSIVQHAVEEFASSDKWTKILGDISMP